MRIGIGYDAHPLEEGRPLVLGGVAITHDRGLRGHSDADVLCHAVADAVLGAAGLDNLGKLFPPGEERTRGASSLEFLAAVAQKLEERGLSIVNVDAVVVADAPRLEPHVPEMRLNLARALRITAEQVGVKPKSNEGMGFEGERAGMSARAVALVEPR